jgi:hypothetical protein
MSSSRAINLAGMIPPFVIPNITSYFLFELCILAATICVSNPISPQLQYSLWELFSFISPFLNFKLLLYYYKTNNNNINNQNILSLPLLQIAYSFSFYRSLFTNRYVGESVFHAHTLELIQLSLKVPILFY